ncbi:MAG: type II toxin-antitoxin system RelE/ParE family toxin [Alphaproteobacteria bacterium]|nr:type II toxin-antitoxin system RelE/ParE family toxin [Alphaproteobacteria bacterium]
MRYRILWSFEAGRNLLNIRAYIQAENPGAASRVVAAIRESALGLQTLPHRGKPGRKHGTRELILPNPPWIIGYCVDDKARTVTILHIHHWAQLRE